jgi:hypothetical protein
MGHLYSPRTFNNYGVITYQFGHTAPANTEEQPADSEQEWCQQEQQRQPVTTAAAAKTCTLVRYCK